MSSYSLLIPYYIEIYNFKGSKAYCTQFNGRPIPLGIVYIYDLYEFIPDLYKYIYGLDEYIWFIRILYTLLHKILKISNQ